MKRLVVLLVGLLSVPALYAGTPGSFRGIVVSGPRGETSAGWVYLRGANGMVRRVAVNKAEISYDSHVPAAMRKSDPEPTALVEGTDVRVTAEIDPSGEWRASRVEILGRRNVQMFDDPMFDDDDDEQTPTVHRIVLQSI